jgi:hypothetical protein
MADMETRKKFYQRWHYELQCPEDKTEPLQYVKKADGPYLTGIEKDVLVNGKWAKVVLFDGGGCELLENVLIHNSEDRRDEANRPAMCTLSSKDRQKRQSQLQAPLRQRLLKAEPRPNGYSYVFPAWPAIWTELAHLVGLEKQCCRFLSFRLEMLADQRTIELHVSGPPEAQEIVAGLFGSPSDADPGR